MNKLFETVSNNMSRAGFEVRKHSPEILTGVGIISMIAGTILACRATLKAKPVVEDHKNKVVKIRNTYEEEKETGLYSEKARNRDIAKTYAGTCMELAKLYACPVILVTASICSFLGSKKVLSDRNAATAAAFAGLSETLRGYRRRVANAIGTEEERNIWAQPNPEDIANDAGNYKVDEDEKKKKYTKKGAPQMGPYARIFDAANPGWDDNPEFTLYHLRAVQAVCNNTLQAKKFIFLNEVYDMLGYERTRAGQVVGWIYDPTNSAKIDFGIYKTDNPANARFLDGTEQNIILDFNVDGVILNEIPKN